MWLKMNWAICFLSVFTVMIERLNEVTCFEIVLNTTALQCQPKHKDSFLPVGESVAYYFKEKHSKQNSSLAPGDYINCFWGFKALHDGYFVELYFHSIEPENGCNDSSIEVYVSGTFYEKICSRKKVEEMKLLGKAIFLKYSFLKEPKTTHFLKVIVRETSPVNPGCDFKTKEIGYRYHLLYDLTSAGAAPKDFGKIPAQGNLLLNVPFTLTLVNRENLGVTPCFDDFIIIPIEEIPSCHSAVDINCGWKKSSDISLVYELSDLKGYHWKINKKGTFKTKPIMLELDAICMYIEYLLSNIQGKGTFNIFALMNNKLTLLTKYSLQSEMWETVRLSLPLPSYLKGVTTQIVLEVEADVIVYINKIFGCNPYTMEDRHFISAGKNVLLFGSIEKEFQRSTGWCKNGGLLYGDECICPIGFHGIHCELGCGENKFGSDCGSYCSIFSSGCRQIIFCDDIVGCSCASGFTGEYCHIECNDKKYGANCQQKCGFCFDDTSCNIFTGYCDSGCKNGYLEPYCKDSLMHFIKPPNITNLSYEEITVTANINNETVLGVGSPSSYMVQTKQCDHKTWKSSEPEAISSVDRIVAVQRNLNADDCYNIRLLLLNKAKKYFEYQVPFTSFQTLCQGYIKYAINLLELWASGAKISWQKEKNDSADCIIKEYDLYITNGSNWKKFKVWSREFEFTSLLPDTTYRVKIKPVDENAVDENGAFSYVSFTTPTKCSDYVHDLKTLNIGAHDTDVTWEMGSDKQAKFILSYTCIKLLADPRVDCSKDQKKIVVTNSNEYKLKELYPFRQYNITVRYETCPEITNHNPLQFITRTDVPKVAPVNGVIKSISSTGVDITWSLPFDCSDCNGLIIGCYIYVTDKNHEKHYAGFVKTTNMSLKNLYPKMEYTIKIYLVNENGWNDSSFMKISFTTPPENSN
ncbi:angiopoietin-1 receptor [Halyomorpha halys]|uniref:angiopoietin-1 receptor n=1 Tax=Halyomorpha halys TaxID=286706 RepID=UPI0006D51BA9|nr:angiopoietin-1 receptor-like [Halyomorpha halys]